FRKILVALHKSLILVLTTSILLSVNSCLSDQILSFTAKERNEAVASWGIDIKVRAFPIT
ncbi:MAG: hypothetical protein O7162_04430, partial [Wolbachia endosymbiont of Andrena minutula]|nr:hypothetical protein [Wolbachia endosymbiont of Andrena minutula]